MKEQEQIKGITRLLEETHGICGNFSGCTNRKCSQCYAEALYNAGYRKADEVRKGTAEKIFAQIEKDLSECTIVNEGGYGWNYQGYEATDLRKRLTKLAKQFGVEVEE